MKSWRYIIFLWFLCWTGPVYCQNQTLLEIIGADRSLEAKQKKIDSFLLVSSERSTRAELADIHHDLALFWYHSTWINTGSEKYLLDAIAHTKEAVLLKSTLDSIDLISLKRSLYNLGFLQKLHGDFFASISSHLRLVELGGKDNRVKEAHQELGDSYRTIGDFQKALDHLERALSIAQNEGENYAATATAHIAMADNYSTMGHREYADKIKLNLQKADSLIAQDTNTNIFIRAQIAMLRGNLMLMLGDYESAKQHHLRVLEYTNSHLKEFSHTDLKHNLATIHNSLGVSYDKLGETNVALEHLNNAMHLNEEFSLPFENLGDLYLDFADFEKGLLHYQKAISLATGSNLEVNYDDIPTPEDLELSPEKVYLLRHLVAKANGWMRFYEQDGNADRLDQALKTFEAADQLIDIIRSESTEQQSKLYWRGQSANLYMKAVEACYLLERPERAYYFMERNKALLLLEEITQEQARQLSQLPDSIASREFRLKTVIHLAENELKNSTTVSKDTIDQIKNKVYSAKRRYDRFVDSLNNSYPDYARLKSRLAVLSYEDFNKRYPNGEQAVLQYILNDVQGYGLLNTKEENILFKLGEGSKLNDSIAKLHRLLSDFNTDEQWVTDYNALSHHIFNILLPGIVYEQIKGKQVIVVPDFTLQKIPLDALVVNLGQGNYLIEDTELRYAYSISYLDAKKNIATSPAKRLIAIAPVTFESLGLGDLSLSALEVNEIQKIYKGELLMHEAATKARVLEQFANHAIIHLSTHADIDENGNHWVAFSDDKLYLNEIYATKNQADMVVLSACNTSRGELQIGEGVMSLARAFFNAGAKSVVSSLWPVEDASGKDLMVSFYKGLNDGLTKSAALRQAKLQFIEQNRDTPFNPSYWAPLIVIGDNSPIQSDSVLSDHWALMVAGSLAFLLMVKLIVRKRFRHRKKVAVAEVS